MFTQLKQNAKKLKKEILPVYYALFDRRTPVLAKFIAGLTVGYLLSPIDLIPDFIPVLGLLDDIIIVTLLISATLKLIPKDVLDDIRLKIDSEERLAKKWYFAFPVVLLYGYLLYEVYLKLPA